jgi:hypothetical protein
LIQRYLKDEASSNRSRRSTASLRSSRLKEINSEISSFGISERSTLVGSHCG